MNLAIAIMKRQSPLNSSAIPSLVCPQRLELGLQLCKMAKVMTNPGEEQDGAGDRRHDGPRPLGHRLGRQKTG